MSREIQSLLTQKLGVRWNEDRLRDLDQFLARGVDRADTDALADFMNGETYFFRYPAYLAVLEAGLDRHTAERPFRIWCAACSSGEEAYSVAFALLDQAERTGKQVDIVGSDVRPRAIAAARSAVYGPWSLRNLAPADRPRRFEPWNGETWRVREPYRSAPRFVVRNLLDAVVDAPYDAILLCNATLYMEPFAAERVYARMESCLQPEGLLLLAPTDPSPGAAWTSAGEDGAWSIFRRATPRPEPPPPAAPRMPPRPTAVASAPILALKELRQRIFLEPESPLWRFLNGVALWEQGWLRRADREIERAVQLAAELADDRSVAGLCSAAELRTMIAQWRNRHG